MMSTFSTNLLYLFQPVELYLLNKPPWKPSQRNFHHLPVPQRRGNNNNNNNNNNSTAMT